MQNGCKIKVGDKKIFLCQRSTDHIPQQVVVKSNFGFQLGINFDNGLQIAVDSQMWTVDKKALDNYWTKKISEELGDLNDKSKN
jgi:hypothetical protein